MTIGNQRKAFSTVNVNPSMATFLESYKLHGRPTPVHVMHVWHSCFQTGSWVLFTDKNPYKMAAVYDEHTLIPAWLEFWIASIFLTTLQKCIKTFFRVTFIPSSIPSTHHRKPFSIATRWKECYTCIRSPPPYFIVLVSSMRTLEVKAIEFHRIGLCYRWACRPTGVACRPTCILCWGLWARAIYRLWLQCREHVRCSSIKANTHADTGKFTQYCLNTGRASPQLIQHWNDVTGMLWLANAAYRIGLYTHKISYALFINIGTNNKNTNWAYTNRPYRLNI